MVTTGLGTPSSSAITLSVDILLVGSFRRSQRGRDSKCYIIPRGISARWVVVHLQGCSLNHIGSFLVFFQLGTTDVLTRPCPSTFPQHCRPTRQWWSIEVIPGTLYMKSLPHSSPVHCLQFKALHSSSKFFRQNPCSLHSWLSLQKPWQTAVPLIKWFLLPQGPAASFLWLPNIPHTRQMSGRGQERFSKPKLLYNTTDALGMEIGLS